ncbi:MAG TPA: SGNH/GDSL hydrolase family protein [Anaerolineales bacterium]|nr:SGNH/GDSL hydrolase family protein [Anaerolineales bacterium]
MRRTTKGGPGLSRRQWIALLTIELFACATLPILLWGVFVDPTPPDFSAILNRPTQPDIETSPTATAQPPAATDPPPTPTKLPIVLIATSQPTDTATPLTSVSAQVSANGSGLNLRAGPDQAQPIITTLLPLTLITIVGRSADGAWLMVVAPPGNKGWVSSEFVEVSASLDAIPVTAATVEAVTTTPIASPALAETHTPTPAPPSPADSGDYPYIIGITDHARQIFLVGQQLGNRAKVFSKVGDSITVNENFLIPFGIGDYNLGEYAYLQAVIDYFSAATARTGNSFANISLSADPGWSSWTAINGYAADESICLPGEMPIACELRMVKPSVALIMLGTNDVPDTDNVSPSAYERQVRTVIETTINMGVIPVISTLPEFHRPSGYRVALFNEAILKLADEYDIPLWNYWAALQNLPNDGLSSDGVHPSVAPTSATDFSPEGLKYGMNMRNLTALQALDAVWRYVLR